MRIGLVGAVRFELTTPYTPCRCPTWLGHAPTLRIIIHQIPQCKQPAPGNSRPNGKAPLSQKGGWGDIPILHPEMTPSSPHRHSGAGRNPEPRLTPGVDGWRFRPGLAMGGVSPSPNPLPLGEGFLLGGGCRFRNSGPGIVMRGRGARPGAPTLYGRQRRIITAPPHKAARRKPSPSGRGLGEGESHCTRQPSPAPGVNRGSGFRPAPE